MPTGSGVILHDEKLDKRKIKLISFISFLSGFSQALLLYVMSYYFRDATGSDNIGIFYTVSYIVVLFILLNLHKIVRKVGKLRNYFFTLLAKIIVIFALTMFEPSYISIIFLMGYIILGSLEWTNLDIILESFSQDNLSGRIRGVHLTVFNLGFLLAPFLSTKILGWMGFHGIFVIILLINMFILTISMIGLRNINHEFKQRLKVVDVLAKAFRRKDIMRIYYVSFVLEFFFALMVIYTPLYLLDIGFTWENIGVIFTIMLIPFVVVQYPAGFLADKRLGEKEMIIFSLIVVALATLSVYFIDSLSIWVWGAVLFATRIGAALIELLRDSYFYKRIDGYDVDLINFMRTSMPVAYIISTALSTVVILFLSIKVTFILVSFVALSGLRAAWRLEDNKSEKEERAAAQPIVRQA